MLVLNMVPLPLFPRPKVLAWGAEILSGGTLADDKQGPCMVTGNSSHLSEVRAWMAPDKDSAPRGGGDLGEGATLSAREGCPTSEQIWAKCMELH